MHTLNWRRRKTPITLDAMLKSQRRQFEKGRREIRLLVTDDQKKRIYGLIQTQVRDASDLNEVSKAQLFGAIHIVTPKG